MTVVSLFELAEEGKITFGVNIIKGMCYHGYVSLLFK